DGSYTLTPAQLSGLKLNAAEAGGTLHVVVTSSEGGVSTTSSADIAVTVNPVAEPASLAGTVLTASGNEDTAIALTIVATPFDTDDSLSIKISGIPAGATLNQGTLNADGSYTLTPAQLSGLKLNAAEAGGTLHVVVTSSESGVSTTSSADIAVTVNPVAEPASLAGTVLTASGNEDTAIALTIVATPFDADDSLSIEISGIPAGATLNQGTLNADGSYTLTPAQLSGLQLNAAEAGGTLHVVVTSSEGGVSTTSSADIAVTVNPVAEPASLAGTVLTASGNEDTAIALTIVATAFDTDDNLSINISRIPAGATLNQGTLNPDGSYTLTPAQLSGLKLNAAEAGGTLHVVVTSSESGVSTTSSANIAVTVNPVAEAASLAGTVTSVSGDSDTAIPLTIVVTPFDTDD